MRHISIWEFESAEQAAEKACISGHSSAGVSFSCVFEQHVCRRRADIFVSEGHFIGLQTHFGLSRPPLQSEPIFSCAPSYTLRWPVAHSWLFSNSDRPPATEMIVTDSTAIPGAKPIARPALNAGTLLEWKFRETSGGKSSSHA
jgi:hypothetical protein